MIDLDAHFFRLNLMDILFKNHFVDVGKKSTKLKWHWTGYVSHSVDHTSSRRGRSRFRRRHFLRRWKAAAQNSEQSKDKGLFAQLWDTIVAIFLKIPPYLLPVN